MQKKQLLTKKDFTVVMIAVLSVALVYSMANIGTASADEWYTGVNWTLLMQAHAPAYGTTSISQTTSYQEKFRIGPEGTQSSLSSSVTVCPSNGDCAARFQLCWWEKHRWWFLWWHEQVYIKSTYSTYLTSSIKGNSALTCSDDREQIEWEDVYSMTFNSRYQQQDLREDNPSGAWVYRERTASQGTYCEMDVSVSVGFTGGSVSTGVFDLYNADTHTWRYTYGLAPHHSWSIDYKDSMQDLWTFNNNW
jgi:hypothetical protein